MRATKDKTGVRLSPDDLQRLQASCANVEGAIARFEDLTTGLRNALAVMVEIQTTGRVTQADRAALSAAFDRDWRTMIQAATRAWSLQ